VHAFFLLSLSLSLSQFPIPSLQQLTSAVDRVGSLRARTVMRASLGGGRKKEEKV